MSPGAMTERCGVWDLGTGTPIGDPIRTFGYVHAMAAASWIVGLWSSPGTEDRTVRVRNLVGLDYSIWPGRLAGLGSSLSDLLGGLPARVPSAELPDGAGPARGVQGCRAAGTPARERGAAPPDRPGPLPAGRPAVARSAVPANPPAPAGRGVRGDPRDAAGLAPPASHPQMGLLQPAAPRTTTDGSRDPQARDPHRHGQSGLGAPARARRTRQARSPDRRLHGLAD